MGELVNQNIIKRPVAGSATAVQPMYPGGGVPGMYGKSKKVVDTAKEVFDALVEDDEPVEQIETISDPLIEETAHETP